MITIASTDKFLKDVLDTLFNDNLDISNKLYSWIDCLYEFNNVSLFLDIDPRIGIVNVLKLPSNVIEKLENSDLDNPHYVQYSWKDRNLVFENSQIINFQVTAEDRKHMHRVQNIIVRELRKIAMIHLLALGYSGLSLVDFDLTISDFSKLWSR